MLQLKRKTSLHLFLFFLSLYLLTAYGFLSNFDNESVYQTTKSLVETGSLAWQDNAITQIMVLGNYTLAEGADGRSYSWFGIFLAVAWTPFFWLGQLLQTRFDWVYPFYLYTNVETELLPRFFISLFNAVVTAWTCALLYQLSRRLGYGEKTAVGVSLLFGLGTIAWEYSRSAFSEPLAALLLLAHFYHLVGYKQTRQPRHLLFAGITFPLLFLTKSILLLIGLPSALYLLGIRPYRFRHWLWYGVPIIAGGAIFAATNYGRFGNILEIGYGDIASTAYFSFPLWLGLYGLLLSPGKGLFLYSPLLILSLPALACFYRRHRPEALFILLTATLIITIYAKAIGWTGGWSWGPRYLVMVVPLLALPLAEFLGRYGRSPLWRTFFTLCIFMQAFLLLAFYPAFLELALQMETNFYVISLGQRFSPLVGQFKMAYYNLIGQNYADLLPGTSLNTFQLAGEPWQHFLWVWFYRFVSPNIIWVLVIVLAVFLTSSYRLTEIFRRGEAAG